MFRIPLKRPAELIGDITQMANAYRAAAGLDIANRLAALAYGIQPVGLMVSAFVQVNFIRADLLILKVLRYGSQMPAIGFDLAFGAGE